MAEEVTIQIEQPERLAGKTLAGRRIPIGAPGDYKPCVAKLPSGELVLVAFVPGALWAGPRYRNREEILLFRSSDGGMTWSGPENLTVDKGLCGREPYFTVLSDGTVFITVHFLIDDVRNTIGYCRGLVHRSADGGRTWTTTATEPDGMKAGEVCCTTRNILEMQDGSLLLGTSTPGGDASWVWRSFDRGKTWSEMYATEIEGVDETYPSVFYGEGFWWQARSGKIFLAKRVDHRWAAKQFGDDISALEGYTDQYGRMVLYETTDEAHTLQQVRTLGGLGQMYPAIMRLQDGRLLCTFTVRTLREPLGVRAILGEERDDDLVLDLDHDRFVLDTQTAPDVHSGGGFGPTVQLDDGTLVTSYSWRDRKPATHLEVIRWRLP